MRTIIEARILPGHEGSSADLPPAHSPPGLLAAATTQRDQDFYPLWACWSLCRGLHTHASAKHAPHRRQVRAGARRPWPPRSPSGGSSPGQNDSCPVSPRGSSPPTSGPGPEWSPQGGRERDLLQPQGGTDATVGTGRQASPRRAGGHRESGSTFPKEGPSLVPPLSSPGRNGEATGQGRAGEPSSHCDRHSEPLHSLVTAVAPNSPGTPVRGSSSPSPQSGARATARDRTVRERSGWQHREKLASAQDAGSARPHGGQPCDQARPPPPTHWVTQACVHTITQAHAGAAPAVTALTPRARPAPG